MPVRIKIKEAPYQTIVNLQAPHHFNVRLPPWPPPFEPHCQFFHALYCRIAAADLYEMGLSTEYVSIDIDAENADWSGVVRKYWTLPVYRMPVCHWKAGPDAPAG